MCEGGARAPLVVVIAGEGEGEDPDPQAAVGCHVLTVGVGDWYASLSPWPAPSAWPRDPRVPAFAGGAPQTLEGLVARIFEVEEAHGLAPTARAIEGYSLGGLFSTYAHVLHPEIFLASASGSGSYWYQGWLDWLHEGFGQRDLAGHLFAFSLGSKESHVRNPTMAQVREGTRRTREELASHHALTTFSPEPGGHFTDVAGRQERLLGQLAAWLTVRER